MYEALKVKGPLCRIWGQSSIRHVTTEAHRRPNQTPASESAFCCSHFRGDGDEGCSADCNSAISKLQITKSNKVGL